MSRWFWPLVAVAAGGLLALHYGRLRRVMACEKIGGVPVTGETWRDVVCLDRSAIRRKP